MERYLKDLKNKWQTSLDLLAEEVDAPFGVFVRFLPGAWEIFVSKSDADILIPTGIRFKGNLIEQDQTSFLAKGTFCRRLEPARIADNLLPVLKNNNITHCCGFSVEFQKELFGFLFLAGHYPFVLDDKREHFLLRFKTLLEEDLLVVADKARYCDELTQARLNAAEGGQERRSASQDLLSSVLEVSVNPAGSIEIHPETIPVLPLMDDLHRSHESYLPRNVKLVTRIRCPSDYSLFTDEYYLKLLLSRLLKSAEDHTDRGEIKIECRLDKEHDSFLFTISNTGKDSIQDQTEENLTVTRTLSEKLGGQLTFRSDENRGTVSTLSLPLDHHIEASA